MPCLLVNKPVGRLTDTQLIGMLKQPEAWTAIPDDQKASLYALLPPIQDPHTGVELPIDTSAHPLHHPIYREALNEFIVYIEKQISNGFNKKAWLDEAKEATIQRSRGAYEWAKVADCEEYWGSKPAARKDVNGDHEVGHVNGINEALKEEGKVEVIDVDAKD